MLKKIPAEQPDSSNLPEKSRRKKGKKYKCGPKSKLQKKESFLKTAECKIIKSVGMKMVCYGKKAKDFKSHKEFRNLIADMQKSVLMLQKQQRKFIRDDREKRKK